MIRCILFFFYILLNTLSGFSQSQNDTLGVSDFNTTVVGAEKYVVQLTEKTADIINGTGRLLLVDLTSNKSVNRVIERAQENYKGNWISDRAKINPKKIIIGEVTVLKFIRIINPSSPGYKCNLQLVLKIVETESTKIIDSYEFSGQSSGVSITQESAVQETLSNMSQSINSWILSKFPLKLKLVKVLKESSKAIEEVVISGGSSQRLNSGDKFEIIFLDNSFNPPIPEIIGEGEVQNVLNENYSSLKIIPGDKAKLKKLFSSSQSSLIFRSK
jgi:hypothetical protein